MFRRDDRITRTWQDNSFPGPANFPLRAVKPAHSYYTLVLHGQIDVRFAEIWILIIFPRQIGGTQRQIGNPISGSLQLHDLFPVPRLITRELIAHEPSWRVNKISLATTCIN